MDNDNFDNLKWIKIIFRTKKIAQTIGPNIILYFLPIVRILIFAIGFS
jgi:hypothetical protein